jgi:hypothetical protein
MNNRDKRLLWDRQLFNERQLKSLIENLQKQRITAAGNSYTGWTAETMTAILVRQIFDG